MLSGPRFCGRAAHVTLDADATETWDMRKRRRTGDKRKGSGTPRPAPENVGRAEPADDRKEGARSPTVQALLDSGLVGMWRDRTDIGDSVEFARRLRDEAQRRR